MGNLAGRKLRKEYDKDIQKASRGRYRPELMGVFRYSTSKLSNIPQHEGLGWGLSRGSLGPRYEELTE